MKVTLFDGQSMSKCVLYTALVSYAVICYGLCYKEIKKQNQCSSET